MDVDRPDFYGLTALHYGAEYGETRIMKHLIRAGKNDFFNIDKSISPNVYISESKKYVKLSPNETEKIYSMWHVIQ